jgi:DNA-binding response OmpR family regulator
VVLPLIKAERLAADETEKAAGLQFNSTGDEETPQVLLVEDEEQLLAFVARELSERFRVTSCCSAEEAIDLLKDELPDLIISDVMLPGMPGTLFCRQVKEQAHTSHLPVILLTARDSSDDILDGLASGADDYLVKPFKMVELIARCSNLIENRKRLQQRFAEQESLDSVHFASHPADQDFLDKAFSFVTKNIDNPELDVSCFCQEMGVSKTLLYSKLKALTVCRPLNLFATFD